MIGMTMGDKDRPHRTPGECCRQRVTVRVELRARIDDHDVTESDDVCAGAAVRELRGVVGDHTTHERCQLLGLSVAK